MMKPFSLEFKHIHTFGVVGKMGSQPNYFKLPSDIKISNKHQVVLISDTGNKRIQVFDLTSRQYKLSINFRARPQHLCIESNYNGQGDEAFYFSCGDTSCIFKYDLRMVLEAIEQDQPFNFVWKSQKLNNPQGVSIDYHHPRQQQQDHQSGEVDCVTDQVENLVFVGELGTGRMRILKASDGEDVQSSEFRYKCRPYYMSFTSDGNDLVVSEPIFEDRVQMFHKSASSSGGEWISTSKFGRKGSGEVEFQNPYGIVFDEVSKHIIVADSFNCRLCVFNVDGTLVKSFGKKGQGVDEFCTPNGIYLDQLRGELYVCDFANQRVLVYQ